jgi:hypothetical protein
MMQRSFPAILLFITAATANALIVTNAWVPIFKGIDHTTARMIPDAVDPRLQAVNALRIDLSDPDVQMFSDPPCTNCPLGTETRGYTTSRFLKTYGVRVAVNANFYSPCCSEPEGSPMDVIGLSISNGRVASQQEGPVDASNVMFTTNKQVIMIATNWPPTRTNGIYTAVSGHYPLVTNGVSFGHIYTNDTTDPYVHLVQPRTAVGVSQDGRYLYLITIDGRQPGYSDGALDQETGDWLVRFGTYKGINLDGGGSVTMVMADCAGNPIQLNRAIDSGIPGQERVIANHLGVFAKPLPGFISQLAAAPVDTIATITWTTDSNADSQVEYGLTTSYGSFSYFDPTPVTNHVITLSGLTPNAKYFFRAISSAGATPAAADCYFSTSSTSLQEGVFDVTQGWKWRTNNLNGIKWQAPKYDDSAWAGPSPGLLYVEDNPAVSNRNTPLPPNNGVPIPGVVVSLTYYFRTHFNIGNAPAVTALLFTSFVDDGAVFYLNGAEIYRLRMPPPPAVITFTNFATGSPCLGDATCPDVFSISGGLLTNLVSGDNVLAAELHQYGVYDAVFGSALSYQTHTVFTPTLKIVPSGNTATNTAVISWNATGFTLQQSLSPAGSWFDVPGPVTNTPYATRILSPASFYRLRSQ